MNSKNEIMVDILRGGVKQCNYPLADILLTYIENPEKFPALQKYWPTPETILDNTPESQMNLSRLLFDAKFYVPDKELNRFLSKVNGQAEKVIEIKNEAQIAHAAETAYLGMHALNSIPRIPIAN